VSSGGEDDLLLVTIVPAFLKMCFRNVAFVVLGAKILVG